VAGPRRPGGGRRYARRVAAIPAALLDDGRRRRLAEFAMPAAVILAGVLIVVAFALIVNRAMRSGPDEEPIHAQPPALGSVPIAPPTGYPAVPSATQSPSPTPTPPPARHPAPPAGDGHALTLSRGAVPSFVDLAKEGTRDWVHWGGENAFSLERDKDGGFAILEGSPTAPRFRHGLSRQLFAWHDGSPVDHSDGTPTGIRTCGKGNGFALSAPAGPTQRTLRLYVGVAAARGRLVANLSTGGDAATAYLEGRGATLDTAVFRLTYRAPAEGRLRLTWRTEASFSNDCGGVALEAATLR
jgi:hypothetical protein